VKLIAVRKVWGKIFAGQGDIV